MSDKAIHLGELILQTVNSFRDRQAYILQLLGEPREDWATYLLHMCWDLGSACISSLIGGTVSENPQQSRLVTLLVYLWSSYPLRVPLSFPQLLHKSPKLHSMLAFVSRRGSGLSVGRDRRGGQMARRMNGNLRLATLWVWGNITRMCQKPEMGEDPEGPWGR